MDSSRKLKFGKEVEALPVLTGTDVETALGYEPANDDNVVKSVGYNGKAASLPISTGKVNLTITDFSQTESGLVPAPMAGGQGKFLKADGTWSGGASKTGSTLDLSNIFGNNYNYTTPSAATTYTTTTPVINGFARCFINTPTEPTVTGATKIAGADFIPNTTMEMVVESPDGTNAEYYFIER